MYMSFFKNRKFKVFNEIIEITEIRMISMKSNDVETHTF